MPAKRVHLTNIQANKVSCLSRKVQDSLLLFNEMISLFGSRKKQHKTESCPKKLNLPRRKNSIRAPLCALCSCSCTEHTLFHYFRSAASVKWKWGKHIVTRACTYHVPDKTKLKMCHTHNTMLVAHYGNALSINTIVSEFLSDGKRCNCWFFLFFLIVFLLLCVCFFSVPVVCALIFLSCRLAKWNKCRYVWWKSRRKNE